MMIHIGSDSTKSSLTNVKADDVQPNAVDVRVAKILKIYPSLFLIDETSKAHRQTKPVEVNDEGYWELEPGCYEIVMENTVTLGDDEAGWVITRSTLNRNGVFITSGLYDSGYSGVIAGCLHVTGGRMEIAPGTRVGQFLLFKSEMLHRYEGSYGLKSDHDKKYQ